MSSLRRRVGKLISADSSTEASREGSPTKGEDVELVSSAKLAKLRQGKKGKRRTTLIFVLGGIFGLVVAAFFADQNNVIDLNGMSQLGLDSVFDVLPAGLIQDVNDITASRIFKADLGWVIVLMKDLSRNTSKKLSTTIRFPWAYIFSRRASKRYIQSSWCQELSLLDSKAGARTRRRGSISEKGYGAAGA